MGKLLLLTLNEQEEKMIDQYKQIKILYVTSHKDREFFGIEYGVPMLAVPLF